MTARPLEDLSIPRASYIKTLDLILVAVITAAVFMPNLHGRLSPLDDYPMLVGTPQFKAPTWAGYWSFWFAPTFRIFMPLTMTVWQAVAYFSYRPQFEPQPWAMAAIGFKAASIVGHVLSAAAATWALSLITRSRWPAVVGGLLFALHPLQVESMCWTTGLKDVLCGLFALLSIGYYASYLRENASSPWKSWRWYAAFAASILAMLSKPTGLMLPVSLVAVDIALRPGPLVRRLPSLWLFLFPAVGCAAIIRMLQSSPIVPEVPIWARPFVVGDAFAFYLYKLALPFHLAEDYGRHPQMIWQNGQIWWTWLLPAAVLAGLLFSRNRLILLGAALFIIPILPVSGILPFDMQRYSTVCDHYVYQSMFGIALILAIALRQPRVWLTAATAIVLCGLAILSWQDTRLWQRPQALYETLLKDNSRSLMAHSMLAGLALQVGDLAYATQMAEQAKLLNPKFGDAYFHLAVIHVRQGQFREGGEAAKRAIELGNGNALVAQKMTECGMQINDGKMAYQGVIGWLHFDAGNPTALNILNRLRQSMAAQQQSRPTNGNGPAAADGPAAY